jgi:hypothetical protein
MILSFKGWRTKKFELIPFVDPFAVREVEYYPNGKVKRIAYKDNAEIDKAPEQWKEAQGKSMVVIGNDIKPMEG